MEVEREALGEHLQFRETAESDNGGQLWRRESNTTIAHLCRDVGVVVVTVRFALVASAVGEMASVGEQSGCCL